MALGEALEEAIGEIEKLKSKIHKYQDKYSGNEALVRYSLIDPLLRMIGWDTSNPDQVIPEYSTGNGRADYALIGSDEEVIALLGAKKLGTGENIDQHLAYCLSVPSQYFIATDGNVWELYDAFKKVKIQEKVIERWVISDEPPGEILKKALRISNFSEFGKGTGSNIRKDSETLFQEQSDPINKSTFIEIDRAKRNPPSRPKKLFVQGQEIKVSTVREVLIAVAEWLIKHGKLRPIDVPVESGPLRYIVNKEPLHKSGKKYFDDYLLSNGLHLEVHGSHQAIEASSMLLMERFGYSKNTISIEWSDGKN